MSDQSFQIKVSSIDNSQIDIIVNNNMLISDLKNLILPQTQVPVDRQRLLYKGKLLKNDATLQSCGVASQSIIQLVAYLDRNSEEESLSEVIRSALESLPNNYVTNRRGRDQRRREIDNNERMESLRQNLQTMESILSGQRKFNKGQWVDVKDTVDQWLEAQVIDIAHTATGSKVYIHYNGWPSRWDEWIDINSPRIQFFKTHTYQSLASPMYSPHPVSQVDAENLRNISPFDINDCILQGLGLMEQVLAMMNVYNEGQSQNSIEIRRIGSILAPLMDRFGKFMCDLAGIIGNTQRINDENESISSSLITNESGVSNNSGIRPPMQIPVMPAPSELALMNPRMGPDFDIHIHAFFALRNLEQEPRGQLWDNSA